MANATAARDDKQSQGDVVTYKLAAQKVYAGTLITNNTSGFAVKGADTAGFSFAGVAADTVDNASGAAGDKKIDCYTEGTFEFAFSGTATQADVGKLVYVVDDSTVGLAATTTNDVLVGKLVEFVNASTVRVKI
jgi:hypothetical protein